MKNNCSSCGSGHGVESTGKGSPDSYWKEVRPVFAKYPKPHCYWCWFEGGVVFSCDTCPIGSVRNSMASLFASKTKSYNELSVSAKKELREIMELKVTAKNLEKFIPQAEEFGKKYCVSSEKRKTPHDYSAEDSAKKYIFAMIREVEGFGGKRSYTLAQVSTPGWNEKDLVWSKHFHVVHSKAEYTKIVKEVEEWVWSHYSKKEYTLIFL